MKKLLKTKYLTNKTRGNITLLALCFIQIFTINYLYSQTSNNSAYTQIEAENYDGQSGIELSNEGISIGFIDTGDWVRFDDIDFGSGATSVTANVSKGSSGTGTIQFRQGSINGTLLGQLQFGNTGGWTTFTNVTGSISNSSGIEDLYLVFTGSLDVNWFEFSNNNTSLSAFSQIEAEDYDGQSGIELSNGGAAVGFIDTGDWIRFDDVDFGSGATSVTANLSKGSSGTGIVEFRKGSTNGTLLGQLQVSNTGDWTTFIDVTGTISNSAGTDDLYLVFTGGLDVNWIQFSTISGFSQIEAEDYDGQSGIELSNGGAAVGYVDTGDWIRFDDVAFGSGASSVRANVSSNNEGGTIEFRQGSINGTLLGQVEFGNTGGWTSFIDVTSSISNSAGVYDLYLVFTGSLDVNWIEFSTDDNSGNGIFNITSPKRYQVFQRDASGRGEILIEGTYAGNISEGIEARWNNSGSWTTMTINGNGTFSGTLSNQNQGQGSLSVRLIDDISTEASVTYVGVGDIFIITGQSNASGRGRTNNSYSHSTLKAGLFGNDDNWKELVDPLDDDEGQVDNVSRDPGARGTPFTLSTTDILADQNIPIAWVPCAKGGSRISGWIPEADHSDRSSLYGSMYRRINAIGGKAKGVVFYQGEGDASDQTSQQQYENSLNSFINAVASDFPGLKVMVGQVGPSLYQGADPVRAAQQNVIKNNPNALRGPATYDMDLSDFDNLHYREDADVIEFSRRWTFALDKVFYGGSFGFGPIVDDSNITYNTSSNTIVVPFISETSPALLSTSTVSNSSFDLYNDGQLVSISSVNILGDTVELTLASSLDTSESIKLTYGSLNEAVNNAIYDDNLLPAQTFYNLDVIAVSGDAKLNTSQDTELLIYPNPVSDILEIRGLNTENNIRIYNLLGTTILETKTSNTIDVSTLDTGIYIISVGGKKSKFLKE